MITNLKVHEENLKPLNSLSKIKVLLIDRFTVLNYQYHWSLMEMVLQIFYYFSAVTDSQLKIKCKIIKSTICAAI